MRPVMCRAGHLSGGAGGREHGRLLQTHARIQVRPYSIVKLSEPRWCRCRMITTVLTPNLSNLTVKV